VTPGEPAVAVETPTVSRATATELLTSDPLPWVVAEVPYQRGVTGRHWLIVTAASAHALASVGPVSGEGRVELDPGGLDAVRARQGRGGAAVGEPRERGPDDWLDLGVPPCP